MNTTEAYKSGMDDQLTSFEILKFV